MVTYMLTGEVGLEASPGRDTKPDPRLGNDDLTGAWAGVPSNLNPFVPAYPLGRSEITVNIGDVGISAPDDRLCPYKLDCCLFTRCSYSMHFHLHIHLISLFS